MSLADRKWTDLERRMRWFFENCGPYIDSEMLDLLIFAKWNNMRDKLQFEVQEEGVKFKDILALAKKLEKLQSK